MNIAILFVNIGYYHYTRLVSAFDVCAKKNWRAVGIQVADSTLEHPWGSIGEESRVPIVKMNSQRDTYISAIGEIPGVSKRRVHESLDEIQPDIVFLPGWSFEICKQCLSWCRKKS